MGALILKQLLEQSEYTKFETGISDITLMGRMREGKMRYVAIYDESISGEVNCIDMQEYIANIKSMFASKNVLFVIFSMDSGKTRNELGAIYGYWIYDLAMRHLMIYDDQPQDYPDVEKIIESVTFDYKPLAKKQPLAIATYLIVAANIIVFFITMFLGDVTSASYLATKGGLVPYLVTEKHEYYRLFTSMFLHGGLQHILGNMIVLIFTGATLEMAVGKIKFSIIYFISGLAGSVAALIYYNSFSPYVCCIGASGAIFGTIGALLYILIVNKGKHESLTLTRMLIFIIMSIYLGVRSEGTCLSAHIGGLICGFILTAVCYRKGDSKK